MSTRIRTAFLTIAVLLGLGLTAAPASAAGGSCVEPGISGTVSKVTPTYRGGQYYSFTAAGRTAGFCTGGSYEYKYAVTFHVRSNQGSVTTYSGTQQATIGCSSYGCYRTGTSIAFPAVTLPVADSETFGGDYFYDGLEVTLRTWQRPAGSVVWTSLPSHTFDYKKQYPEGSYDTGSMLQNGDSCSTSTGPVVGKAWC